jgi:Spy/CpxP family protein refolding chaperone
MRKLTLVFSFALAVALCPLLLSNAFGQPPAGGPGQRGQRPTPEQRLERLDKLAGGLTADQKKKITAIWGAAEKNREQQPPAAGERPNARREQLNQNRQSGQGGGRMGGFGMLSPEVEKVLTPEQVKKYQSNLKKENIDRQLDRLKDLNLTDAQKKKLTAIFEKQNETMRQNMEKMQGNQDPQARMDAFRKMREASDKEIMTVLTPDQKKKYEDMQQQMREWMQNRGQGRGQQQ